MLFNLGGTSRICEGQEAGYKSKTLQKPAASIATVNDDVLE